MYKAKKHLALFLALVMALSLGAVPALASDGFEPIVVVDNEYGTVTVTDYDPDGKWAPRSN